MKVGKMNTGIKYIFSEFNPTNKVFYFNTAISTLGL